MQAVAKYAMEHPMEVVEGVKQGFNIAKKVYKGSRKAAKRQIDAVNNKNKSWKPSFKVSMSGGSGQLKSMKKRRKRTVRKASLKKRVARLEGANKQNYATHNYKANDTFQVTATSNRCGYNSGILTDATIIENVLAVIPWVDPAVPGTAKNYDARTVTLPTKWTVNVHTTATMRNNYLYPLNVRCYVIKPKSEITTSPTAAITAGITLQANPSIYSTTDPWLYPSDSKEFRDGWTILSSCNMKLQSGDEMQLPYNEVFKYDQEYKDQHTATYLPKYSRILMVRVCGVVCHDSVTTTAVGISPSAIDVIINRKLTIKVPAAAPTLNMFCGTNLGTITTGVVGVASAEVETSL